MTLEALVPELLAAWRRAHHPRIGDALEAITARLPAREALAASKKQADLQAWREVDAKGDPLDVPRLLAAARGGQQDDVTRQMRALAKRDDPRFSRGVLALLEKPPYAGVPSRPMLRTLVDLLIAAKDRRAAEPARELASRYLGIVHSSTGAQVVKWLEEAAAKLEALKEPGLSDADAALCAEAEALAPPAARALRVVAPRLEELFSLVEQHLDDDGPRRVLADALLEAGDGRGDFILAQLDGRPADHTHPDVARWLQPLSLAGSVTCERGFPSAVSVYKKAVRPNRLWRTVTAVRDLHKLSVTATADLLDAPDLLNLRQVRPVSSKVLDKLQDRRRAWRELLISGLDAPSPASLARFPELEQLEVTLRVAPPDGFFAPTPKLTRLTLSHQAGALPPTLLAPLTSLRTAVLRGVARALVLPRALETLTLEGGFAQADFSQCTRLAKLTCGAHALAHQPEVPSLRELALRTEGERHGLEGLTGLRHLRLGHGSTLAPELLRPLRQLLSLELSFTKALTAAHLEGLESLVSLSGMWTDWDGLPSLPSLRFFDCMTPRTAAPLAELLSRAPDLEVLRLHWNSSSDLYFHPPDFDARGWARLAAVLAPSKVRVVDFHDDATLVRAPGGPWQLAWRQRRGTTLEQAQRLATGPLAVMNGA
ncbi:MAG: hypothetical protein ACOZQL_19890 [Myxococcota bacterium]